MSLSEIGSNFVTGLEKFTFHLVMGQVYHSNGWGCEQSSNLQSDFPRDYFCIARIEMGPEQ